MPDDAGRALYKALGYLFDGRAIEEGNSKLPVSRRVKVSMAEIDSDGRHAALLFR